MNRSPLSLMLPVLPRWVLSVLLTAALCGCPGPKAPGAAPAGAAKKPAAPVLHQGMDASSRVLAGAGEGDVATLKRYFAGSADWKLTQLGGIPVAIRREVADESTPDAGKLRMSADGFYFKHQPWRRYRTLIRFGKAPLPVDAAWQAVRTEAPASGRDLALPVAPAELPDYRSYLVVSGEAQVALEIQEESMDTTRETTRRLLREVNEELTKALSGAAQLQQRGYVPGLGSKASVTTGPAVLKAESAHTPNAFHVLGYFNPGTAGTVHARLFDAAGTPVAPDAVREQTQEQCGWSKEPKNRFFFNSQVRLPAGSALPVNVQLWFRPDNGQPERKVLEARVPAAVRR
ncbi:MAG: hypothetical protein K0Q72_2391 [Armatimonadetes bacterium]|nr:hypothetical protein [Armatimonadota bacterium]